MTTNKDFLVSRKELLQTLDSYTDNQIDSIAESFNYYSDNVRNRFKAESIIKVYNLLNEIMKIIIRNNLLSIYYNGYSEHLDEYELKVEYDELEPFYDDLSKRSKKTNKWLTKHAHYRLIKRDLLHFATLISTNGILRDLLTERSDSIFYKFNEMFTLFEEMGMNKQDIISATLCIVANNIYNGIYTDTAEGIEFEDIKKAHHLLEDEYLLKIETKEECNIDSIIKAFSLLGYSKPESLSSVFEKIDKKKLNEDKTPKINTESLKVEVEPMISKNDYYEGMQIISKYYDLENHILKKTLRIAEIQYVVTIMQNLDFSGSTIETFISKALKKHKSISALDRYLDLSNKIEYYKGIKDIESLDRTLHDLVNEYINSSSKDKEFWLTSINEELEALENILNQDHNYELGIKKTEE